MNITIFVFGLIIGFAIALMIIGFVTSADRLDSKNNPEAENQRLKEALYIYQNFISDSGFTKLYHEYVKRTALGITDEEEWEEVEADELKMDEVDEWEEDEADE